MLGVTPGLLDFEKPPEVEQRLVELRIMHQRGFEDIPCGIVVRSIGYQGMGLPGVPFDAKRCVIPNVAGRVVRAEGEGASGQYAVGWIKRGPTGLIGSNKSDSQHTVDTLVADLADAAHDEDYSSELVEWLLSLQPALITDDHWQLIDRHERSSGEPHGRPRVKLASVAELLRIGHG